jgi:uncharacterized protein (TIGR04255 family)
MESTRTRRRKYRNPPLVEAVAEFRFDPGGPWDQTLPGLIYEELRDGFPQKEQVQMLQEELVTPRPGQVEKHYAPVERLRLSRVDGTAVVGLSPHYLSISRLPPYQEWEEFQPLIATAVEAYRRQAEPTGIVRAGLRAINRVTLENEPLELDEYFEFYPYVGARLPTAHGPFICGIQIPYEDHRDLLRLQLADQPSDTGKPTVLLDIDYFLNVANAIDFAQWADWLENAHIRVRDVFEGCITDQLRERFKEVRD